MTRWIVLIALFAWTACIDGTGPRPRPGTIDDEEPSPTNNPVTVVSAEMQPHVITLGTTDTVVLNVTLSGMPNSAVVQLRTGPLIVMRRVSGSSYTAKLPASQMLFGYRAGDLHQAAGIIEVSSAGGSSEMILMANVKDNALPLSRLTTHSPSAQSSDHILNLRYDTPLLGADVPAAVLRSFYSLFPDEYHFIAVIEPTHSRASTFYRAVKNDVTGIGSPIFNVSSQFGSAGRLEGIIQYPVDAQFDLARTDNIHEISHRWMNHLTHPLLNAARPHWPISSLAFGIMGLAGAEPPDWDPFPFDITRQLDGTYVLRAIDAPRAFNDFELYLMGMVPADSVQPHIIFRDQNQRAQVRANGVLRGAVDTLRMASVLAQAGARNPSAELAPRDFRMATIILSRGRLLTADELAFFEYMAARGEMRVALPYSDGLTRGNTLPFYLATGGRGTLTTRLRNAQMPG